MHLHHVGALGIYVSQVTVFLIYVVCLHVRLFISLRKEPYFLTSKSIAVFNLNVPVFCMSL